MDRGMSRLRTCLLALAASAGFALAAAPPALAAGHVTKTEVACPGAVVGAEGTCTVTVKDTEASPTLPEGNVSFGSPHGTFSPEAKCALAGSGSEASCSVHFTPSEAGSVEVHANYPEGGGHAASEGKATITVAKRSVEVTLTCPASVPVNESGECIAVAKDTSPGAVSTPTGELSFSAGLSPAKCALIQVVTGEAHCSTNFKSATVGTQKVKATYAGDELHGGGESPESTVKVVVRPTTTTLSCPQLVVGEPLECTATVKDEGENPATPTGEVKLVLVGHPGSFAPEKCVLTAVKAGEAHCSGTVTAGEGGADSAAAEYEGDSKHGPSTGEERFQVFLRQTKVTLSCGGAVLAGQAAECEVTVLDNSPGNKSAPEGEVRFGTSGSGTFAAACKLEPVSGHSESSCKETYVPREVGSGVHTISAEYVDTKAGGRFNGSKEEAGVAVSARSTSVSVNCGTPVAVSQQATCKVTVRDTSLAGTPSAPAGEPEFTTDSPGSFSSTRCPLSAVAAGESACTVTYTPSQVGTGAHTVTAKYAGDGAHLGASGLIGLSVSAPGPTTTTTTTTNSGPPPPPPGAPKCRLSVKEQWRPVGSKRHPREMPVLLVPYTCNQNATVKVEGVITIAASRHGTKKVKAGTVKLLPGTSAAHAESPAPAVVLALPATVANAIVAGAKTIAAVTFVVRNANGAGAATLKLTLVAQAHKRKKH